MNKKEMAAASDLSPDRRAQGNRTVLMAVEVPPGTRVLKQAHLQCFAAAARTDHGDEPNMPVFSGDVYGFRVQTIGQFLGKHGRKRALAPYPEPPNDPVPNPK